MFPSSNNLLSSCISCLQHLFGWAVPQLAPCVRSDIASLLLSIFLSLGPRIPRIPVSHSDGISLATATVTLTLRISRLHTASKLV